MGPIWDRQDPGGAHVGPMNFAIWDVLFTTHRGLISGAEVFVNYDYAALDIWSDFISIKTGEQDS